jgi:hypothetical protein
MFTAVNVSHYTIPSECLGDVLRSIWVLSTDHLTPNSVLHLRISIPFQPVHLFMHNDHKVSLLTILLPLSGLSSGLPSGAYADIHSIRKGRGFVKCNYNLAFEGGSRIGVVPTPALLHPTMMPLIVSGSSITVWPCASYAVQVFIPLVKLSRDSIERQCHHDYSPREKPAQRGRFWPLPLRPPPTFKYLSSWSNPPNRIHSGETPPSGTVSHIDFTVYISFYHTTRWSH